MYVSLTCIHTCNSFDCHWFNIHCKWSLTTLTTNSKQQQQSNQTDILLLDTIGVSAAGVNFCIISFIQQIKAHILCMQYLGCWPNVQNASLWCVWQWCCSHYMCIMPIRWCWCDNCYPSYPNILVTKNVRLWSKNTIILVYGLQQSW